jgi:senataxin
VDAAEPFHVARVGVGAARVRSYKDNDLVLISRTNPHPPAPESADGAGADADAAGAHGADDADGVDGVAEDAEAGVHALALVEQTEGESLLRLRLHLPTGAKTGAEAARFASLRAGLRTRHSAWFVLRLCNLSTIQREWLGLHGARGVPFADVILSSRARAGAQRHWRCPSALEAALAARFNASQLAAIQAGLETAPVVLIQGPPGTGKTATLQALLSLIMHAVPAALGGGLPRAGGAESAAAAAASGVGRSAALAPEARRAAWARASPWLFGAPNGRDAGPPPPGAPCHPPRGHPPAAPLPLGFAQTRNPHVLVCAPSNSALDEIVLRLLQDGVLDSSGATYTPSLVRVGVHPHASVREVTMDALVDQVSGKGRVAAAARARHHPFCARGWILTLVLFLCSSFLCAQRIALQQRGARAAALAPVAGDVAGLRASAAPAAAPSRHTPSAASAGGAPDSEDEDEATAAGTILGAPRRRPQIGTPLERDRARLAILDECAIVASTLSFSGSGLFTRMQRSFDVVVIDEAAQAVEPSILVPLSYGCRQLFLVGDPIQLPATVLSDAAKARGYDTSLFKRLQAAGHPVHVLKTQYRMHPEIRAFPSREFYAEALEDGPAVAAATSRPWHAHPALGPFTFWDVAGEEMRPEGGGGSWMNLAEARLALALARAFLAAAPSLAARHDGLAVVSPYRGQVALIQALFSAELGEELARRIDVNTIDGFQGREREVVLFSVVRSPKDAAGKKRKNADGSAAAPRIGFVADERRMNVGLTRARAALVVIGNAAALRGDVHWGSLVEDAIARGRIVTAADAEVTSYDDQIAALGELPAGAPLQAVADVAGGEAGEEEEWAPQAEAHVAAAEAEGDYSGDEGAEGWAYGDGRDGGADVDGGGDEDEGAFDGAAAAAAAGRAAKRQRAGGAAAGGRGRGGGARGAAGAAAKRGRR